MNSLIDLFYYLHFFVKLNFLAGFESRFTFQAELPPPEPFNTSLSKNYPSKKEKGIG